MLVTTSHISHQYHILAYNVYLSGRWSYNQNSDAIILKYGCNVSFNATIRSTLIAKYLTITLKPFESNWLFRIMKWKWIELGWPVSMLKLLSLCKPLWWFICKGSSTEMNSWKFKIWNDVNCSYVILKFLFEFFVFCKLYFSLGQFLGRSHTNIFSVIWSISRWIWCLI